MKDSTKLFISSFVLLVCGLIKGACPMIIDNPFDISGFVSITAISVIALVFAIIKHRKNK